MHALHLKVQQAQIIKSFPEKLQQTTKNQIGQNRKLWALLDDNIINMGWYKQQFVVSWNIKHIFFRGNIHLTSWMSLTDVFYLDAHSILQRKNCPQFKFVLCALFPTCFLHGFLYIQMNSKNMCTTD